MLIKTSGIIIHQVKYSESARIIDILTSEYGRVSYMVRSVGKKRAIKPAHLQPLTMVEMEVNHRANRDLQYIKELRIKTPLHNIYLNPVKSSIAMFVAEVLRKTLEKSHQDDKLFTFLEKTIILLEKSEKNIANFHLLFMAQLTVYFGFSPNFENYNNRRYFDLFNGTFEQEKPISHSYFLENEKKELFVKTMKYGFENMEKIALNRKQRNDILDSLCQYFQLHIPTFHSLKSVDVLKEIFI